MSGEFPAWGAALRGTVRTSPPYPAPEHIAVKKEIHHCGAAQVSQKLIIGPDGEVQNAVVSLIGEFKAEEKWEKNRGQTPILAQRDCQFLPHILLVPQDHPFLITNEDPMAHDVRAFSGSKMLTRFEMDTGDTPVERKFTETGPIVIRCGLHKWMHAFVISTEHSHYTITDERGEFQLTDLPVGQFQVKIWHEVLGETIHSVTLQEESFSRLDFTYTTVDQEKP